MATTGGTTVDRDYTTHADDPTVVVRTTFGQVPHWIAPLGSKAILAYYALTFHADHATRECRPSVKTLAGHVGVCPNSMREGLHTLEAAGAVVVQERTRSDGFQTSNAYVLRHDPPGLQDMEGRTPPQGGRASTTRSAGLDEGGLELAPDGASVVADPERADIEEVVTALAAHVRTTTSRDPSVTKAWRRDVRLMLDGPGKSPPEWTVEQLLFVIGWLDTPTRDAQFWAPNILCPSKLRAQMPKLVAAIRRERAAPAGGRDVESRIAAIRAGTRTEVSPLFLAAAQQLKSGRAAS